MTRRPFPPEYDQIVTLADGAVVHFRPIQADDEPLWLALVSESSERTVRARFHGSPGRLTHELAMRFCDLDFARELAIVAEAQGDDHPRLIAVGRLAADDRHDQAEYALMVLDEWQRRGLGRKLTDFCIECARRWGVRKLVAITEADNAHMLRLLRRCGFATHFGPLPSDPVKSTLLLSTL